MTLATSHASKAAIGHALAFHTWRSLALEQGLGDRQAAELMSALAEAAQAPAETAGHAIVRRARDRRDRHRVRIRG